MGFGLGKRRDESHTPFVLLWATIRHELFFRIGWMSIGVISFSTVSYTVA